MSKYYCRDCGKEIPTDKVLVYYGGDPSNDKPLSPFFLDPECAQHYNILGTWLKSLTQDQLEYLHKLLMEG